MKKKENVKNLIIALIFGIVAFIVLLVINSRITQNEIDMVWSVKEIPQGITLTEDNIDDYVSAKLTNDVIKTDDIILSKKQLIGMTSLRQITTSELLQKSFFTKDTDARNNFNNPVLVSFSASDFTGTANGIIRRGDHINVSKLVDKNVITAQSTTTASTGSATDGNSDSTESANDAITATTENLVVENAYVVDAFDSSGVKIEPGDTTSIATSFNIYIEKDDETTFYNNVNDKNIAVAKIESSKEKKDE